MPADARAAEPEHNEPAQTEPAHTGRDPVWGEPDEADPRQPRRLSWGCLAAMIIGGIGLIVVVIIVANLAGTALSGVHIR